MNSESPKASSNSMFRLIFPPCMPSNLYKKINLLTSKTPNDTQQPIIRQKTKENNNHLELHDKHIWCSKYKHLLSGNREFLTTERRKNSI